MSRIKSVYKSIDGLKIDENYDLFAAQITEIANHSADRFTGICDGFRFGYLQGMKAAKAERRRTV